jgi:hypothetical protein
MNRAMKKTLFLSFILTFAFAGLALSQSYSAKELTQMKISKDKIEKTRGQSQIAFSVDRKKSLVIQTQKTNLKTGAAENMSSVFQVQEPTSPISIRAFREFPGGYEIFVLKENRLELCRSTEEGFVISSFEVTENQETKEKTEFQVPASRSEAPQEKPTETSAEAPAEKEFEIMEVAPIETTIVMPAKEEGTFRVIKVLERLGVPISAGEVIAEADVPLRGGLEHHQYVLESISGSTATVSYRVWNVSAEAQKQTVTVSLSGPQKEGELVLHFGSVDKQLRLRVKLTPQNQLIATK